MRWLSKRKLSAAVLSFMAVLVIGSGVAQAIPTDLVGSVSPMASQTDGQHPFHNLILSDHGKVQSVLVGMYFRTAGDQQFRVNVSQWCDMRPGNNYAGNKTFIVLEYGSQVTYITGQQACNGWLDGQTFTIPAGQIQQNFRDSTMFGARVSLRWVRDNDNNSACVGGANSCNPIRNYLSGVASGEGSRIRFRFNPLGGGSRVGLIETNNASTSETNNSIVQASGEYSNIYMPFGLSCSETNALANGSVSVYDADNGLAAQSQSLYFYVGTLGANGAVTPLSASDYRGEGGGAATGINDIRVTEDPASGTRTGVTQALRDNSRGYPVFTPSNFNNVGGVTTVQIFRVQPATKYVLMIMRQHAGQFTYIGVPGDALFGSPDFECQSAEIIPRATVNGSDANIDVPLGSALTFRNWAVTRNVSGTGDDTFRLRAVTTQGTIPGGDWGPDDRRIAPARDVPDDRNVISFVPATPGTYCRETQISNPMPSYVRTPNGLTQRICARVIADLPPGTIIPISSLDQTEYEVGGSANGTAAYTSTFQMPEPILYNGIATQEYRGLDLSYTSRMWYDDGSETYPATGDVQTNTSTQTNQQVGTPATNSALNTWPRSPLVLQSHANPNFKLCVSMQISGASYETRNRTVTQINSVWTPGSWSNWSRVNVMYDDQITTTCAPIYRYPSLRVVNGDIKIGGVFKQGLTACERTVTDLNNHAIVGHAHAVEGTLRGSKGQYGVLALGRIANFGSNNLLATQAGSTTLTFANAGGTLGEFFGTATGTIPTSCFNETYTAYPVAAESSSGSATLGATGNTNTTHRLNGSGDTLTITGGTVGAGERRIIRVTGSGGGTVVLNGNISFAPVGNIDQIPQFILLVEAPNVDIRVASGVTTLSGLYVTQGSFATCHEFNGSTTSPNIHIDSGSPCYNALTVKGAVITGKSVLPYRTNAASTTYSDPAEIVDLNGTILISDYARKQQTGNFMTIGQMELPPRF